MAFLNEDESICRSANGTHIVQPGTGNYARARWCSLIRSNRASMLSYATKNVWLCILRDLLQRGREFRPTH